MTREYKPDAITLDICLPDIDGWRVMDRLKNDMTTRHIPVCVISTEEARDRAASYGALSVLTKPFQSRETLEQLLDDIRDFIGRRVKDLVVVGPDAGHVATRSSDSIGGDEFRVTTAASGRRGPRAPRRQAGRLPGARLVAARHDARRVPPARSARDQAGPRPCR